MIDSLCPRASHISSPRWGAIGEISWATVAATERGMVCALVIRLTNSIRAAIAVLKRKASRSVVTLAMVL